MDQDILIVRFQRSNSILLIALIGYCLRTSTGMIDTPSVSRMIVLIGTPALVFSALMTSALPIETLLHLSFVSACVCAVVVVMVPFRL